MGQRLSRAKSKIRSTQIAYQVPEGADLEERLQTVLAVLYLIFNQGYSEPQGQADLRVEAIRLCRILFHLMPDPEVGGLLCLMQFHHARRDARLVEGRMVSLEKQDRERWHNVEIVEAAHCLRALLGQRRPGPFQLQAAISALHCEAKSWEATDWQQISGLYGALYRISPNPVVALNHAVAMAETGAVAEALMKLNGLHADLEDYQPFYAARSELLRRRGDLRSARADLRKAISLSQAAEERVFLAERLEALGKPA
jgi:RNA polymerase sigma-70 factor (ECF subfamily)